MERSILKEVSKKNMETYLNARAFPIVLFPLFFPMKKTAFLTFETIIGDQDSAIAADVVTYDSSAPIKSRQTVGKLVGEIPPIRVKRVMRERDINEYNILSAMASPDQKTILDLVFGDVDFAYESVQARLEWITLQALSTGTMNLTLDNNNGVVTEVAVDFQVPADNKTGVAITWGTGATATPLTDIRKVVAMADANGHMLQFMLMRQAQFEAMRKTTEVKGEVIGTVKTKAPTLEETNTFLLAEGLPTIKLIKQSIGIEKADGTIVRVNPWDEHKVTFLPELRCGDMLCGPLASVTNPPAEEVQVVKNNILVAKYRKTDPVNEFTRGEINAFPSWKSVNRTYLMNTNNVTTWA